MKKTEKPKAPKITAKPLPFRPEPKMSSGAINKPPRRTQGK